MKTKILTVILVIIIVVSVAVMTIMAIYRDNPTKNLYLICSVALGVCTVTGLVSFILLDANNNLPKCILSELPETYILLFLILAFSIVLLYKYTVYK